MSPFLEKAGSFIRNNREVSGLSMDEVSEFSFLSKGTIHNIEKGQIRLATLRPISTAISISTVHELALGALVGAYHKLQKYYLDPDEFKDLSIHELISLTRKYTKTVGEEALAYAPFIATLSHHDFELFPDEDLEESDYFMDTVFNVGLIMIDFGEHLIAVDAFEAVYRSSYTDNKIRVLALTNLLPCYSYQGKPDLAIEKIDFIDKHFQLVQRDQLFVELQRGVALAMLGEDPIYKVSKKSLEASCKLLSSPEFIQSCTDVGYPVWGVRALSTAGVLGGLLKKEGSVELCLQSVREARKMKAADSIRLHCQIDEARCIAHNNPQYAKEEFMNIRKEAKSLGIQSVVKACSRYLRLFSVFSILLLSLLVLTPKAQAHEKNAGMYWTPSTIRLNKPPTRPYFSQKFRISEKR